MTYTKKFWIKIGLKACKVIQKGTWKLEKRWKSNAIYKMYMYVFICPVAQSDMRLSIKELMLSNCGAGEDSWESLGQQGDQTSQP